MLRVEDQRQVCCDDLPANLPACPHVCYRYLRSGGLSRCAARTSERASPETSGSRARPAVAAGVRPDCGIVLASTALRRRHSLGEQGSRHRSQAATCRRISCRGVLEERQHRRVRCGKHEAGASVWGSPGRTGNHRTIRYGNEERVRARTSRRAQPPPAGSDALLGRRRSRHPASCIVRRRRGPRCGICPSRPGTRVARPRPRSSCRRASGTASTKIRDSTRY